MLIKYLIHVRDKTLALKFSPEVGGKGRVDIGGHGYCLRPSSFWRPFKMARQWTPKELCRAVIL